MANTARRPRPPNNAVFLLTKPNNLPLPVVVSVVVVVVVVSSVEPPPLPKPPPPPKPPPDTIPPFGLGTMLGVTPGIKVPAGVTEGVSEAGSTENTGAGPVGAVAGFTVIITSADPVAPLSSVTVNSKV